jgi:two-component system sensor histidine kinase KdpD
MPEGFTDQAGGGEEAVSQASIDHDVADVVERAGHFRIYLGSAPGVGKTLAMLDEGHRRLKRGTDVVIGFCESHGRPLTQERMDGLEMVPRKVVHYRGADFDEMDVDAVLARHPRVALVDELAHTNVPGSGRNEKRWQDVIELLDSGIDVITTVNIQHLESIADAVERMTGTPVRERVPDWLMRKADQIELVDSSPEQLRRRMLHGNIYAPEKVPQALNNFFRRDNLIALRELALRFLADETEDELLEHLQRHQTTALWETTERLMVAVTPAPGTEALVRRAARIAARIKADLHVVHVKAGEAYSASANEDLAALQRLAADLGAHWHELTGDNPPDALMDFARRNQVTQIVVGSSQRSRWRELMGGGSTVRRILRLADAEDIDVHVIARRHVSGEKKNPVWAPDGEDGGSLVPN